MSDQIDLNKNVAINLPLGAWNTVLGLIAKGPWDVADPLMNAVRSQIQAAHAKDTQKLREANSIQRPRPVLDQEAS